MEKLFVKFYDLFIVLFCLLVFSILRITVGSSFILYVLIPILGIGAHFGITYFFDVQQARLEASPEYRLLQKQKEDESQLSSCIETLRKLERENDSYYSLIERFLSSVRAFDEKDRLL